MENSIKNFNFFLEYLPQPEPRHLWSQFIEQQKLVSELVCQFWTRMENYCIWQQWKVIIFRKLNEKIWKYSNPKYSSIQVYSLKFCGRCWWWLLDRSEAVLVPNLDLWQTYANVSTGEAIFQTGNYLKYSWTHKNIEDLWFIF